MVSVSSVLKLPLFSRPPTFFLQRLIFLNQVPFIDGKSLHSFPSIFLSGDSQEDTNGASSLLFFVFFFSGGLISSFGVDLVSSLLFHISSNVNFVSQALLFIHLSQFIIRSAQHISEDMFPFLIRSS